MISKRGMIFNLLPKTKYNFFLISASFSYLISFIFLHFAFCNPSFQLHIVLFVCVNENSRWRYCCFFLANESYSQYSVYVNYGDFAQVARLSFICIGIYVIYPLHIIIKVVVRKFEEKK